jgi:hypothetical protein
MMGKAVREEDEIWNVVGTRYISFSSFLEFLTPVLNANEIQCKSYETFLKYCITCWKEPRTKDLALVLLGEF